VTDDLVKRLRKIEPDTPGIRTRWHRNPDGPEAADCIEQLERLLEQRDSFIVKNDLWHDFVSTLGEKKNG